MEAARVSSRPARRRRWPNVLAVLLLAPPLLFAAALFWPLPAPPLPEPGNSRVIVNARVVDVVRGQVSEPTTVMLRDGTITAIGESVDDAALPVFDAGGRWLLPGFWDMHTHALQLSPQLQFPLMLANGITGTRDMMDCPQATDPLIACVADKRRWTAQAIAGQQVAPRFVQVASFYFEDPLLAPEAAAERARTYSARGADALKVYNRCVPTPTSGWPPRRSSCVARWSATCPRPCHWKAHCRRASAASSTPICSCSIASTTRRRGAVARSMARTRPRWPNGWSAATSRTCAAKRSD
ncbi:amidohydrolase family protein [Stenotrophomonas forensis]|uniref:amidohydrolase family protein n=1 Tax=Stenotrophomonas forensis TaxID=2871169 RepID=UPI0036D6939E